LIAGLAKETAQVLGIDPATASDQETQRGIGEYLQAVGSDAQRIQPCPECAWQKVGRYRLEIVGHASHFPPIISIAFSGAKTLAFVADFQRRQVMKGCSALETADAERRLVPQSPGLVKSDRPVCRHPLRNC
jgi:hypothetical protein